jgi:predicted RNase H-like nuclease (RuvC/YqgF family)
MIPEKIKNLAEKLHGVQEELKGVGVELYSTTPDVKEFDIEDLIKKIEEFEKGIKELRAKAPKTQAFSTIDFTGINESIRYLSIYFDNIASNLDDIYNAFKYGARAEDEMVFKKLSQELWILDKHLASTKQYLKMIEAKIIQ